MNKSFALTGRKAFGLLNLGRQPGLGWIGLSARPSDKEFISFSGGETAHSTYWATSYNSGELSREQLLRLEDVAESLGGSFDWDMGYFAMPSEEAAEKMKEAMIDEAAASDSRSNEKESKREAADLDANLRGDIRAARDMVKIMFPDANAELLDKVARDLNQQPLPREQRGQMERIAEKFGLRIRWVKDMPQNGTFNKVEKTIYIATNSWHQLSDTFGHEMTHAGPSYS